MQGLYNIRSTAVSLSNIMPAAISVGMTGKGIEDLSDLSYYEAPINMIKDIDPTKEQVIEPEDVEKSVRKALLMFK